MRCIQSPTLMPGVKIWIRKIDLKACGIHWNLKRCGNSAEQNGYDRHIKRAHMSSFKHHLPHLHTSTVFETSSKNPSRTTTNKVNPLGLDAFDADEAGLQFQMRDRTIDLQHLSQLLAERNCARQTRLTPRHLLTLDPSTPHLGPFITEVIARQIDVNEHAIWLQGCG